ncbi:MAG: Ref family protein [Gallionella sp.]|nr:Ref family protein [Gallionella sp.]
MRGRYTGMSLQSPDKQEKDWMDAIVRLGCVVCHIQGYPGAPAAVHHILSGGRRIGHLNTIPLCDPGHHKNPQSGSGKIPRHPTRRAFELEYGSEASLLEKTQRLVAEQRRMAA